MEFPDQGSPCTPAPDHPCGHQPGTHTYDKPELAPNGFDLVGFLADPRFADGEFFRVSVGVSSSDPVIYSYQYYAGQVAGNYTLKTVAGTPLLPWHFYLTPADTPPGRCETHDRCTTRTLVQVRVPGLEELPKPPIARDYSTGWTRPWPYVRCGKTPCSSINVDQPYNWEAHPTVHWGEPEFEACLRQVAMNWLAACGTNLMIDDLSLPTGGLLDTAEDWRPTETTDKTKGHKNHRWGVNADLSAASVPLGSGGGPPPCGVRPTGGTFAPAWKKTALWTNPVILEETGLKPANNDPGHLMPIR